MVTKQRIPKHDVNVFEYLLKGMYVHEIIILFFDQSFSVFVRYRIPGHDYINAEHFLIHMNLTFDIKTVWSMINLKSVARTLFSVLL